jgi:plastocyanin
VSGRGRKRVAVALVAVAAAAGSVLGLTGGGASARVAPTKVVQVKDDFFTPVSVKVVRNGFVKWRWVNTIHSHNVRLKTAPAGVKKANFASQTSSSPTYIFRRKFTKLGRYHFICSIHPTKMQVNVTVHK